MTPQQEIEADQIRLQLQDIGRKIRKEFPPGWGFSLLVSCSGESGVTLYISTHERADALQVMREFIANNREERNFQREMPELELTEEFEDWWQKQCRRWQFENDVNAKEISLVQQIEKTVKKWCQDAFVAGRASA